MVNVLLEESAHDGRQHFEPGVVQMSDLAFAARVVSRGHGAVVIVPDADGEAAEADLPQTLAALQVKPDTDAAAAVAHGLAKRAQRLERSAAKAARKK
jgi:hypothetical protein